jgi:hypothetical protein
MKHSNTNMSNAKLRSGWAWLGAGGLALAAGAITVAVSLQSSAHPGEGSGFERRCIGTYLVLEQGSGAQTLWTFHADHTLVSSSSGELLFAFGSQQGSWRPEGPFGAKAVQLDFDWDAAGTLEAIGRVDVNVHADDPSCDTLSGDFEGRLFPPGESPLELGDTPALFGDLVTGQRVQVP